jgi:hypothetical protein
VAQSSITTLVQPGGQVGGRPRIAMRIACRMSLSRQYSRIAMSKYQVRRISITSNSRARPGGNTS